MPTIDIHLSPTGPDDEKCDFCSERHPAWEYPARDFAAEGAPYGSIGAWGACDTCHDLIEADDWEGVVERSHQSFLAQHNPRPEHRAPLREAQSNLLRQFREARTGPAQAYDPSSP